MKTTKELDNRLLRRREIQILVEAKSNPGFKIAEKVAEHFKASPDMVVIKKIESGFGKSEFLVDAYIYENVEAKSIEPKPRKKAKAEAPAGEVK